MNEGKRRGDWKGRGRSGKEEIKIGIEVIGRKRV